MSEPRGTPADDPAEMISLLLANCERRRNPVPDPERFVQRLQRGVLARLVEQEQEQQQRQKPARGFPPSAATPGRRRFGSPSSTEPPGIQDAGGPGGSEGPA